MTVKRYWRILHDLYAHAVLCRLIKDNPATPAEPKNSERTPSLALTPNMWVQLQEGLPGGHDYQGRRNRLVLLLLMRCALTVSEVISLKTSSVTPHDGTPEEVSQRLALEGLPLLQPESPFWKALEPHPTYKLQIVGEQKEKNRQVILDPRTSKAVHDWLEIRKLESAQGDRKLVLGDSTGRAITAKGLYNICHAHLQKCLAPANDILHLGPNTLRNTCISIWRNQGVTADEILRRCGLKDAGVLARLQNHINPTVYL
ncbi:site-specific integrase (plasmid) [Polaromonas sp. P1-6]|nr:site-specific integrase [Polaromonas sp. P1-6]